MEKTRTKMTTETSMTMKSPAKGNTDFLSPRQSASLRAVSEALLPQELVTPDLDRFLDRAIANIQNTVDRTAACFLLDLLDFPISLLLVFGSLEFKSFTNLPLEQRRRLLEDLEQSQKYEHRKTFCALKRLIMLVAFSQKSADDNANPFWKESGFQAPRLLDDKERLQTARERQRALRQTLLQQPKEQPQQQQDESFDFIIVGTGAGGCMATKVFAERLRGAKILVLEAGRYIPAEELAKNADDEYQSMNQLYEGGGMVQTSNGNLMVMAGSTLGGGTAVNWSCCLPLPTYVLDEWCQFLRVPQTWRDSFLKSQATVLKLLGITDTDRASTWHNTINRKLLSACEALNFEAAPSGQNLRDRQHDSAGLIGLGDAYANKRGGVEFLNEALQQSNNVVVIRDQCRVKRILVENKQAVGVEYRNANGEVYTVRSNKAVILAAGSLRSPTVLQKTPVVRSNHHVGQHLHTHPVCGIFGINPTKVYGGRGAPMSTVCNEFSKHNGTTYGAKIEVPVCYPALLSVAARWGSVEQFRKFALQFDKTMLLLALQRDRGEGRVRENQDGSLSIDYTFDEQDKKSFARTVQGGVRLMMAMGAEHVGTTHVWDEGLELTPEERKVPVAERHSLPSVQKYIEGVPELGYGDLEMSYFSAHQMGTCRMSADAKSGVVDAYGQSWDIKNLFICDTSIFPTASAVNPMVTTMALSHMIVSRIVDQYQDSKTTKPKKVDLSATNDCWKQENRRCLPPLGPFGAAFGGLVMACHRSRRFE